MQNPLRIWAHNFPCDLVVQTARAGGMKARGTFYTKMRNIYSNSRVFKTNNRLART